LRIILGQQTIQILLDIPLRKDRDFLIIPKILYFRRPHPNVIQAPPIKLTVCVGVTHHQKQFLKLSLANITFGQELRSLEFPQILQDPAFAILEEPEGENNMPNYFRD